MRWARREIETTASIAGSAARAFAQPTLAQANRLFQQGLSFGSPAPRRSPPPHIDPRFRHHQIQRHIPGVRRQGLYPLAFVGNADQPGATPAPVPAQVGEGAVVIAAPHAQPVTGSVEADEGDQQQVQGPGEPDPPVAQAGFGDAEAVVDQRFPQLMGQKPEFSAGVRPEHGQEATFVAGMGQPQQGKRVDFAVCAPVDADAVGTQEDGLLAQ